MATRVTVFRQDYWTDCEHASARRCRATNTSPAAGRGGERWQHRYYRWHLRGADGVPLDGDPFETAAAARAEAQHLNAESPTS